MSRALYPSSRHDRPHARVYDHHVRHAAWRALSHPARVLLIETLAAYRTDKPNAFPMGTRRVADQLGVAEKTARKCVLELIEGGWLSVERAGRNTGPRATRERVVSLTRYDTDTTAGDPDLPLKTWRKGTANPVKCAGSSPNQLPGSKHVANDRGSGSKPHKRSDRPTKPQRPATPRTPV